MNKANKILQNEFMLNEAIEKGKKEIIIYDEAFKMPTKKQLKELEKIAKQIEKLNLMMRCVPGKVWGWIKRC